ncbi:MAG TPA: HAMP domain-containing sensor histidine kinase [Longimicrobiales bacterium]|nr:HAMP domain-containing sensor histidine kinase [Longimicrobiales bacterium]
MKRILLLLDQKENQQLLAEELGATHDVAVAADDDALDEAFDLCVLDGRSLDRLWERVQRRKELEQPIFLPFLLVTSRPGVKMITRHVWRSIDELIISPIEKPELRARIEVLLRARALSLAVRQRAEDAEHATNTRDEVMAIVSHDLRNPLNVVLTMSSFLLDNADGLRDKDREQLSMVHRAARQMHRLIQDLLDISGMEAGNVSLQLMPEAVQPMMEEACAALEHVAATRSVDIVCDPAAGLPPVQADRDRALQVFGNLIGNALKYTPEGGTVHLSAAVAGGDVRFTITDTGDGIAAEDLPHVFDRFWQARRTRDGGAGLGLAISRQIVVAHGGEIGVDSEPGNGSTFWFTLPAGEAG